MLKKILTFLTKENITFVLSIFGSLGALFSFITNFFIYKKNLRININSADYRRDLHRLILIITFENRSRLPIAVTSITANIDAKKFEPLSHPHSVGQYTQREGKEVIDRKFTYNLQIPLAIQQLDAVSGHILFEFSPAELETLSTPLTLLIYSTRGQVQRIELQPDEIKWI